MNSYLIYNHFTKKSYKIKSNIFLRYSHSSEMSQRFLKEIALKLYPKYSNEIYSIKKVAGDIGKGRSYRMIDNNWAYQTYHCFDYYNQSIPLTRFTVRYIFNMEDKSYTQNRCKIIWDS